MATVIPMSESEYFYATYDRSGDAIRGCKSMMINGRIMPLRASGAGMEIDSERCMRGEDVMFLAEAVATRNAIAPVSNGAPAAGTLAMTPEIKASRLSDIETCIANQWQAWAVLGDVSYAKFNGEYLGDPIASNSFKSASELLGSLKTGIGFPAGIGTKNPRIGDFHSFRQRDIQSLFDDIAKKQCCVVPLTAARFTVNGMPPWSRALGEYYESVRNERDVDDYRQVTGPRYATSVTVTHNFPPAAGGSRVMLFAYAGGNWSTSKDYPREQDWGDAHCLVPTDGAWHEVSSDGTLTATLGAGTFLDNIVQSCGFANPYPTPPSDSNPRDMKNRSAAWTYSLYSTLGSQGLSGPSFFALFDLHHTNIGHLYG